MLKNLFKPKWQSKNPSTRIKALKHLDKHSSELINLAKNDPDIDVRLAAIKNLQDIKALTYIISHASGAVANSAQKRINELAIDHSIDDEALALVYSFIQDKSIHEKIAADSQKSISVRKQALEQISNQSLLFDLASTDVSKEIQFLAAQKITDLQNLKKLESLSKNNKRLRQLIKEKLKIEQDKQKQLDVLNNLCNELLTLGDNSRWEQDKTRFLTIQQQWKNSNCNIPTKLQERYSHGIASFEKKLKTHQKAEEALAPLRKSYIAMIASLENLSLQLSSSATHNVSQQEIDNIIQAARENWHSIQEQLPTEELTSKEKQYNATIKDLQKTITEFKQKQKALKQFQDLLDKAKQIYAQKHPIQKAEITKLQKQWNSLKIPIGLDISDISSQYKQLINNLRNKSTKQEEILSENLNKISQLLDTMESDIEKDQLGSAIKSFQLANNLLRNLHGIPQAQYSSIKQRLATAAPIVKSAQSWRHWGTDKAREQLIAQAEQLCDDTSIEALIRAKQIKKLRNDWKQLGKMDPSQHQKLWEKFDAICTQAYEPCQQHFANEAQHRKENLIKRIAICEQLQKLEKETDWKNVNWKEITQHINKIRTKWKKIGTVNRSEWKAINDKFNTAMDALEEHLSNERRINWTKRENLVKQAKALEDQLNDDSNPDLAALIEQAKALQSQWKPTVTAKRSDEQKLWERFRTSINTIFDQQRSKYKSIKNEQQQNLKKKQEILKSLQTLLKQEGSAILDAEIKANTLEENFNSINDLPKGNYIKNLDKTFVQLRKELTEKITHTKQQQRINEIVLLGKKAKLCHQKQAGKDVKTTWGDLDTLVDPHLEKQIQQQFDCDIRDEKVLQKNAKKLLDLTLEIETLLELATPEKYQQDRMKYQVSRLSEQMLSTNTTQSNSSVALQKIQDWYLICHVESNLRDELNERFMPVEDWLQEKIATM